MLPCYNVLKVIRKNEKMTKVKRKRLSREKKRRLSFPCHKVQEKQWQLNSELVVWDSQMIALSPEPSQAHRKSQYMTWPFRWCIGVVFNMCWRRNKASFLLHSFHLK